MIDPMDPAQLFAINVLAELAGRDIAKAQREMVNRKGHYRRTKTGELVMVAPHQVAAHIAEHGEPDLPKDTNRSIWMGKQAMEKAIAGFDVMHAMHRKGIGWIDFRQGIPGDGPPDFEHGGGITHIRAKRDYEHQVNPKNPDGNTTLKALPEVIAKGKIANHRGVRLQIELGPYTAIVQHIPATKENPGERWLISGFSKGYAR